MANRMWVARTAAALVPLAVLAAACSSNSNSSGSSAAMKGPALPSAPAKTPESVSETGSTLLFPLISSWATAYQKQFTQPPADKLPVVTITTGGTGSGTGIADASDGTVNIGASDAYLSSSTLSATPTLENIALAISAQQVNYNIPSLKAHLRLNGTVLAQIYTGKVTNWDDPAIKALNKGVALPNLKIVTLHRADSSGDTFLFTSYLNAQDPSAWPVTNVSTSATFPAVAGALGEQGNGGMVAGCAATPGCIAYIGISYLSKTQAAGLGEAELANKSGNYELPTAATISAAAAALTSSTPPSETLSMIDDAAPAGYPIINYEYAIVNKKQANGTVAEDIRAFLHWAVTTGQNATDYLDAVDFQPLPASVVTLSDNQIAKIGA